VHVREGGGREGESGGREVCDSALSAVRKDAVEQESKDPEREGWFLGITCTEWVAKCKREGSTANLSVLDSDAAVSLNFPRLVWLGASRAGVL
jgi:hypothetical protein